MSGLDQRPHSRACGWHQHPHGPACSTDCPTCHGVPVPDLSSEEDEPNWGLPPHAAELLGLVATHDCTESVSWTVRLDGTVQFHVPCSDTFWWATADAETIYEGDMPLFRQCLDDLGEESYLVAELFAARKREMRPMSLWLGTRGSRKWPHSPEALDLFLAAGPERSPKDEG